MYCNAMVDEWECTVDVVGWLIGKVPWVVGWGLRLGGKWNVGL